MSVKSIVSKAPFWSGYLGNLFEHYDTALFGFLAPFLAPIFFPQQEPITALILTYAIIPLGMLARPIGALVFGYLGDRYGRGRALFITLTGMGVVSGCIGFVPTYAQAGILAPLLIYLGRLLQNFFASGEINGGAIFILENAPKKTHDFLSSLYNTSTIAGILLASAGVSCACYTNTIESSWRFLYFFGCITALFGSIVRKASARPDIPRSDTLSKAFWRLCRALKEEKKAIFSVAVVSGFSYANYTMALVLMNGFVPLVSSVTKEQMIALNTSLLFLDFCTLPLFGYLASKISRETLMLGSALAVALLGLPLILFVESGSLTTIIFVRICFVFFGVAFCAPFNSWAQQLVSAKNRYLVISFGYAIGCQLIGGPTASLSLWLFKTTTIVSSIAWYWIFLALASSAVIFLFMRTPQKIADPI